MAGDGPQQTYLPVPAVTALKNEEADKLGLLRGQMERTTSADIRAEGRELQAAAEQTLNVILDLTLDGHVRWASPTWQQVVGTKVESIIGKPITDILLNNKDVFAEALEASRVNDSASKFLKFSVLMGPYSALRTPQITSVDGGEVGEEPYEEVLNLEAQGIMVYDRTTGEESHTMWMIRPSILREVTIDLPEAFVESLGDGAELLAQHLTQLAESGISDPQNNPPPLPVLCRICERQITPWWFPKHTELCLLEHRAEAELQLAQENLSEHRNLIVAVLDALEAQARHRSMSGDNLPQTPPAAEYKGLPIGSNSFPTSGRDSPSSPPSSKDRGSPGLSYARARSFAVRRPLSRIVELVLDLCDTALEISQPALKETRGQSDGEFRTLSPQSEGRISQVLQWQSPSAGSLEHETGLAALCDDTAKLSKAKAEAVSLFRRILDYSERIRNEFTILVQECIDAALEKAARITAGEDSSDSGEDSSDGVGSVNKEEVASMPESSAEIEIRPEPPADSPPADMIFPSSFDGNSIALALRAAWARSPSPSTSPSGRMSSAVSTGSDSPRGCPTPRSQPIPMAPVPLRHNMSAASTDIGQDSDSSLKSTFGSRSRQNRSPAQEVLVTRGGASRERKRTSLVLPRATSSDRQHASSSGPGIPVSPLKIPKARLPIAGLDINNSPIISPTMVGSEFCSPTLPAQQLSYHRRQSSAASSDVFKASLSPRVNLTSQLQPRAVPPSIKDFEIIKPISKGAFGSVYLAKKKSTGDYYAIKALKKADMVAKNQVANVKAERAIMMWQGESEFVAKLYWTFPSKDYIFLVMEYLNGGDCASLIHSFGALPEDWAKRYMAEVVLGVEHLHSREIVHRDLKPDNLLIDQKGHLKLTDFGLSRMGLIGRQKRALSGKGPDPLKPGPFQRSVSIGSSRSASATFDIHANISPGQTPNLTPVNTHEAQPSYFSLSREVSGGTDSLRQNSGSQVDANDSEQLQAAFRRFSLTEDPWNSTAKSSPRDEMGKDDEASTDGLALNQTTSNTSSQKHATPPQVSTMMPPPMALFDPQDRNRRFVGTPDYLAPETIKGVGQDETSDWWSLGCILFEFLFGYPPFHAETPELVFENILGRKIQWPDDDDDDGVSEEAKDLMNRLMCVDASHRLGSNADDKYASGGEEIRKHPWFSDIDWATLNETEASFIPACENPEDTEYFDARGASHQDFTTEFDDQVTSPTTPSADYERPYDALAKVRTQVNSMKRGLMPLHIPPHVRDGRTRRLSEPVAADDFGQFSFKNLPVLEKANKDVIQKLRAEAMQAQARGLVQNSAVSGSSPPSLESSPMLGAGAPLSRAISINKNTNRSTSPSTISHTNSSPSRTSQPSSPLVQFSAGSYHERRKTSSGTSFFPQNGGQGPPPSLIDIPRLPANFRSSSTASSPIRSAKPPASAVDKMATIPSGSSPRSRSHTVGSNESDNSKDRPPSSYKRRSQVIDISPSSSDTDDARQKALLRVQKRRQRSRRLSQISITDGPIFRPLDVLVCEDHPVSSLVICRLLEKLRCRAIVVQDGTEAMRYAMGTIKFDIIMMEFKLPQINGADVARMIRETKNANCHTPVVAVTGYLKELQAPHHFDALVEKPPTLSKLTEVISRLCAWRPQSFGLTPALAPPIPPSSLRKASLPVDDSPTSVSSSYANPLSSSYRGSSREDSLSSVSVFTDADARSEEANPPKKFTADEWASNPGGNGPGGSLDTLTQNQPLHPRRVVDHVIPQLLPYESAPASLQGSSTDLTRRSPSAEAIEAKRKAFASSHGNHGECGESGDDEDEELGRARPRSRSPKASNAGKPRPASKLGIEMFRSDEDDEVEAAAHLHQSRAQPPRLVLDGAELPPRTTLTPPEIFPRRPGNVVKVIDMDAEVVEGDGRVEESLKAPSGGEDDTDPEQTPRASASPARRKV